jgi:uncharacterized protein (DUF1330 family)
MFLFGPDTGGRDHETAITLHNGVSVALAGQVLWNDVDYNGPSDFARGRRMKAYLVLDLSVNDFGGFKKYIAEIPAYIARHSGKYIVQGVQPTTIEGDWKPERMVIIEFPARANAEAFLGDPEIQDLFKVRHDTTTSKLVLVDGCT